MRITALFITLLFVHSELNAQKYNVGIHLNPAFTIPFTNNSTHDEGIHASAIRPNFNTGLNIAYRHKRISLELAANFEQKTFNLKQNILNTAYGGEAYYHIKFTNTSFEFPLLLGYTLSNKKHSTFSIQAGASAEITKISDATPGSGSNALAAMTVYPAYDYNVDSRTVINVIAGFKLSKTTRKLKTFEYGISYHYPLQSSGHYILNTTVISSSGKQQIYHGDYEPKLSFIDLKLCYYFLSFDKHFKRLKYHSDGGEKQLP